MQELPVLTALLATCSSPIRHGPPRGRSPVFIHTTNEKCRAWVRQPTSALTLDMGLALFARPCSFVVSKSTLFGLGRATINSKCMLDLMVMSCDDGPMPLSLYADRRISRDRRLKQCAMGGSYV